MSINRLPKAKISKELKSACEYFKETGRFPLEGLYISPGLALARNNTSSMAVNPKLRVFARSRALDLYEGFKKINRFLGVSPAAGILEEDMPVVFKGTNLGGDFYILSGQEQYLRFIKTPRYLLARADEHITGHFRTPIATMLKKAVVLELASGNGEKTARLLEGIPEEDAPALVIFEDLVRRLCHQAKRQVCKKNYKWESGKPVKGQNDAVECASGNILYQETWDKIHAILERYKDYKLIVLSQGATILNNFTPEQTEILFGHLGKLKLGTEFLISADSTLSKKALRDEYCQPAFFHLVLTSFANIMMEVDRAFNPRDITGCKLEIDDSDGKTAKIAAVINWRGQRLVQQDIVKVSQDEIKRIFNAHGIGVCSRWKAGGSFSGIDHAFAGGVRMENPEACQTMVVTSAPALLPT